MGWGEVVVVVVVSVRRGVGGAVGEEGEEEGRWVGGLWWVGGWYSVVCVWGGEGGGEEGGGEGGRGGREGGGRWGREESWFF